jgi:hypothetical protein
MTGFKVLSFWVTTFQDCLKPSQLSTMNFSVCRIENQCVDCCDWPRYSCRYRTGYVQPPPLRGPPVNTRWRLTIKKNFLSSFSKFMWNTKCRHDEFLHANDNREPMIFNSVNRNHLIHIKNLHFLNNLFSAETLTIWKFPMRSHSRN